jgi:hypothetical protein
LKNPSMASPTSAGASSGKKWLRIGDPMAPWCVCLRLAAKDG